MEEGRKSRKERGSATLRARRRQKNGWQFVLGVWGAPSIPLFVAGKKKRPESTSYTRRRKRTPRGGENSIFLLDRGRKYKSPFLRNGKKERV